jgi:acetylornithine/succinyldiaminopimelate/putrescine aminotransferase
MTRLRAIRSNLVVDVRGRGLWVGVEIDPAWCPRGRSAKP